MFLYSKWRKKGQGVVEYALVLAAVVVIAAAVVHSENLQRATNAVFTSVAGLFGD